MTRIPVSSPDPGAAQASDSRGGLPLVAALVLVLSGFWLLLSGHYTLWLLGWGAASCAVTAWFAVRLGLVDREGMPVHVLPAALRYLPWLLVEIVKANVDVARAILSGNIQPSVFRTHASQKSDLGRVVYANSITLTPGTVTIALEPDGVLVIHALTSGGREGVEAGEMDARVTRLMGEG